MSEVLSAEAAQSKEHRVSIEQLLKAGTHFGHLTSRWNPKMRSYIFMERNGIHIIDLMQTQVMLDTAAEAVARFARQGRTIMFVGTKKQAREIVRKQDRKSTRLNSSHVATSYARFCPNNKTTQAAL